MTQERCKGLIGVFGQNKGLCLEKDCDNVQENVMPRLSRTIEGYRENREESGR